MAGPKNKVAGNAYARQALLPEGFRDQIGAGAEHEAHIVRKLVDHFMSYGYDRVSPPLIEFEDSLLVGPGAERGEQMFRVMDPDTQRVMGVRSDMTIQLSRLATTRLADAPRPLRMAYAGNVLRTKGSQIRPTRQFNQAGVELVGEVGLEAELEVIAVAVTALQALGIKDISLDLTVAPIIRHLIEAFDLSDDEAETVVEALDAKDAGTIARIVGPAGDVFKTLLSASGLADTAIVKLTGLALKGEAGEMITHLAELVSAITTRLPDVNLTIDPCESRGFEYKSGVGFAVFAARGNSEIGRGGQYCVTHPDGRKEPATGFSVYLDSLISVLPEPVPTDKVFIPFGTSVSDVEAARKVHGRTLQGLTEAADPHKEARRLGCSHILIEGKAEAV